ncbi:unnamed protein product [Rotaria sp. Silwood2]|nr:unnamed protein product [Rotaria sp. Silwood2]
MKFSIIFYVTMFGGVGLSVGYPRSDPIVFKWYEDYASTEASPSNSPDKLTTTTPIWKTLDAPRKSSFFSAGFPEWSSSGFHIAVSLVTSGGFVGGCWFGIKVIRAGGICKRSWFYPKSLSKYRRRRELKAGKNIFMVEIGHNQQDSSITSSSPPASLP